MSEVVLVEPCRHVLSNGERCSQDSVVIIWGKYFPQEQLGPRCMDHLPDSLFRYFDWSDWAVTDLRKKSDPQERANGGQVDLKKFQEEHPEDTGESE